MLHAKKTSRIRSSHTILKRNSAKESASDLKKEWRSSGEELSLKEYARKHGKESWLSNKSKKKATK